MKQPTYKEQFDKITTAYFKDEVEPEQSCACFIGNLLNGNEGWEDVRDFEREWTKDYVVTGYLNPNGYWYKRGLAVIAIESGGLYNADQIVEMEKNFLTIWYNGGKTEDSLFLAMSSTLDMLREIHESKGEITEVQPFAKRQLVNS